MEEIKLGIIGHGYRGAKMLNTILECFGDISVTYVCDDYDDRAESAANGLEDYAKRNLLMMKI